MGCKQSDHKNWLITLPVITISGFPCPMDHIIIIWKDTLNLYWGRVRDSLVRKGYRLSQVNQTIWYKNSSFWRWLGKIQISSNCIDFQVSNWLRSQVQKCFGLHSISTHSWKSDLPAWKPLKPCGSIRHWPRCFKNIHFWISKR